PQRRQCLDRRRQRRLQGVRRRPRIEGHRCRYERPRHLYVRGPEDGQGKDDPHRADRRRRGGDEDLAHVQREGDVTDRVRRGKASVCPRRAKTSAPVDRGTIAELRPLRPALLVGFALLAVLAPQAKPSGPLAREVASPFSEPAPGSLAHLKLASTPRAKLRAAAQQAATEATPPAVGDRRIWPALDG